MVRLLLVALTMGMVLKWPLTSVLFLLCWATIVSQTGFVSAFFGHLVTATRIGSSVMEPTAMMQQQVCRNFSIVNELLMALSSPSSPSSSTEDLAVLRAAQAKACTILFFQDWFSSRPWSALALALVGTWLACAALASVMEDAGRSLKRQFRGSVRGLVRNILRSIRFFVCDLWVWVITSTLSVVSFVLRGVTAIIASWGNPVRPQPKLGKGSDGCVNDGTWVNPDEDPSEEDFNEDLDEDYVPYPRGGDEDDEYDDDDDDDDDVPYEYDEDDPRLLLEDLDDGSYEPPASPPRMSARLLGRDYYARRRR
jgi:hypothetical protein